MSEKFGGKLNGILYDKQPQLTNKTCLSGQYGSLRTGQFKLEWYMARSEAMDQNNSNCFNVSTIYSINTHIKGLKSKPFKHFFRDQELLSLLLFIFLFYFLFIFFLGGGGSGGQKAVLFVV